MKKSITPAQAITDYTFTVRVSVDIRKPGMAHTVEAAVAMLITDAMEHYKPLQDVLAVNGDGLPNYSIEAHEDR